MTDQRQDHPTKPSLAPGCEAIETSWDTAKSRVESRDRREKHNVGRQIGVPGLHLKNPLYLRGDAIRNALDIDALPAETHVKIASCIYSVGGAILASVEDLASVSLREIPVRIAPIDSRSMPNLDSLLSADAIELQLGDWSGIRANSESKSSLRSLRIEWPLDTPDMTSLNKKIELLRRLTKDRVPVGVAVPIGDPSEAGIDALRWLPEMAVDFVTIRSAAACLGNRHPASSYFQLDPIDLTQRASSLFHSSGEKSVAIAIDHPWSDGFQAGQAILAGASLVGVASFLANLIPTDSHTNTSRSADTLASGFLGRSSTPSAASLSFFSQKADIHSAIVTFAEQLRSSLEFVI